jgi:hypothetical protein
VYLKCDDDKHTARERYIVISCDPEYVTVRKLVGSQFRSKDYKLKYCEIYPVPSARKPSQPIPTDPYDTDSSEDSNYSFSLSDNEETVSVPIPADIGVDTPNLDNCANDLHDNIIATTDSDSEDNVSRSSQPAESSQALRRSDRVRRPPGWLTPDLWDTRTISSKKKK